MSRKSITSRIQDRKFVVLVEYPIIGIMLFAVWWFFGWTYLVIGIAVFAFLFFLAWHGSKPAKSRLNIAQGDWRKYMETLLHRGYDKGLMMVEAPDGKRSMQFIKCITENDVFLQFQFPRTRWSAEYFTPLQEILNQRNYHSRIWSVSPEDKLGPEIDQVILVFLAQDLEHAIALAKLVLLEVFKLDASDEAIIWYRNVSIINKKIGF